MVFSEINLTSNTIISRFHVEKFEKEAISVGVTNFLEDPAENRRFNLKTERDDGSTNSGFGRVRPAQSELATITGCVD